MRKSSRGNPYHDERGRFCSANKCKTRSERTPEEYEQRTADRLTNGEDDQRFLFKPTIPENTDNPFGFSPTEYDGVTFYLERSNTDGDYYNLYGAIGDCHIKFGASLHGELDKVSVSNGKIEETMAVEYAIGKWGREHETFDLARESKYVKVRAVEDGYAGEMKEEIGKLPAIKKIREEKLKLQHARLRGGLKRDDDTVGISFTELFDDSKKKRVQAIKLSASVYTDCGTDYISIAYPIEKGGRLGNPETYKDCRFKSVGNYFRKDDDELKSGVEDILSRYSKKHGWWK